MYTFKWVHRFTKWLHKILLPRAMRLNGYSVHIGYLMDQSKVYFVTHKVRQSGYHYTTQSYWCPRCSEPLWGGPEGGGSVNLVCTKCNINYGCLPGGYGDNAYEDRRKLSIEEVEAMLGQERAFEQCILGLSHATHT